MAIFLPGVIVISIPSLNCFPSRFKDIFCKISDFWKVVYVSIVSVSAAVKVSSFSMIAFVVDQIISFAQNLQNRVNKELDNCIMANSEPKEA